MPFGEILGLLAGLFTTGSIIPQVIRVYKLKSAKEISLMFNILFLLGGCVWLSYGIYDKLFPVIFWNSIAVVLTAALLIGKLRYGREVPLTIEKGVKVR